MNFLLILLTDEQNVVVMSENRCTNENLWHIKVKMSGATF